ncbi:hypothetical protein Mp_6g01460 [Marchantia polymorpha subsp. ruderalis]|uniref:SAM-dependent MTase RsmB/NOP-type domain-containing protein n=2 Tax=Marchantia polymorpha TaxID=3197 RepID=A0AAF6BME8_MARPO|nr:hypothetical protein MARPO_0052s0057 [Marchantia polymorpha]BBN13182.1 hypothetical protein Mp_6g01460 [Marchantia polymorpha subsp. ruderalis]|eukprot:PTQ38264.1 hypothetical protein MARPO_0052s0057 [Marchantia polymorpha]
MGFFSSWREQTRGVVQQSKLKPQAGVEEIEEIEKDLGVNLSALSWLPGFYSIPPEVQIAGSKSYQEGKIYGMDAASGAAVAALEISPGDHVLDLCAAPGAKLCMLADLLKDSGSLTATDISAHRLAASRTMLIKYDLGNRCRLFLADGTTFSLLPLRGGVDGNATKVEEEKPALDNPDEITKRRYDPTGTLYVDSTVYGEWKGTKTAKEKKAAKRLKYMEDALDRVGGRESELIFYGKASGIVGMKVADVFRSHSLLEDEVSHNGYDKVLVDAECTHDGSLKHISKYEQWGWDTFERRFFNAGRMSSITSLQLQLLRNGFSLLRPGGKIVYSTCSLTKAQNEDVVQKFLDLEPSAELRVIKGSENWPCKNGGLPHTLRFNPSSSKTSGLFIAQIHKHDRLRFE